MIISKSATSVIVIGDVHGCYKTLMALIAKLPSEVPICFTGDLIDRGPMSRQIINHVISSNRYYSVAGNHEIMCVSWTGNQSDAYWFGNGGDSTLRSYTKINHYDEHGTFWPVPDRKFLNKTFENHRNWMKKLPLYIEFPNVKNSMGRYLVVSHSNIFKVWRWDNARRKTHAMDFQNHITEFRYGTIRDVPGIYNIVGHTPIEFGPKIRKCYANIDTGCCWKRLEDTGLARLSAIQFPEMNVFTQEVIDDTKW